MNGKERILAAINHEMPDRIPMDFGSSGVTTIALDAYRKLCKFMGVSNAYEQVLLKTFQITAVDERILERLDIDTRGVYGLPPTISRGIEIDSNTYINEFGIKFHMPEGGLYYSMVDHPLENATKESLLNCKWPEPYDLGRVKGLKEKAEKLHKEGKYAIVGDMVDTGMFEPSWFLRGFENLLMDLIADKEFASALLEKMLNYQLRRFEVYLGAVGKYLDVVLIADDLATAASTIMSPELYREMIKPYQARYFAGVHSMTKAKLMYHSCGAIEGLLGDLIEIGVDILNPVQVSAKAMDTKLLKQKYGGKVAFWGAVDTTIILPTGSREDVEKEVIKRMEDLGPTGYVVAPVHDIQADVPPENILTLFDCARKYGNLKS